MLVPYSETLDRVYDYLRNLALNGLPCPHTSVIGNDLDMNTGRRVDTAMAKLARRGRITIHRRAYTRHISFPDGLETLSAEEAIGDIVAKAGAIFDVRAAHIYGPDRRRDFVFPRFAAITVSLEAGYSSKVVGDILARDHSSILHARKLHSEYALRDPRYHRLTEELRHAAGLVVPERLAA